MKPADIHYPSMVSALIKPGADIQNSLSPEKCDAWHMATGVAGEAGELLDAVMEFYYGAGNLDRVNVIEELGDLEFYLEGICQRYGIEAALAPKHLPWTGVLALTSRLTVVALDLLDTIKKEVVYNKAVDSARLVACVGEIYGLMANIRLNIGADRKEVLEGNIVKLYLGNEKNKARYPDGKFTDAAAQARADKQDTLVTPRGSLGEEVSA